MTKLIFGFLACGLALWHTTSAQVQQAWVAHHTNAYPQAVKVDRAGNVHVVATLGGFPLVLKYDRNGSLLWEATFETVLPGFPVSFSLALDASGGGLIAHGSTTVKYDTSGHELWSKPFPKLWWEPFPNCCTASLAIDSEGNAYVLGGTYGLLVKYDPSGVQLWIAELASAPSGLGRLGLVVDAAGHAYVTANSSDTNGNCCSAWLVKFDPDGNELWRAPFAGGPGYSPPVVTVDGIGHLCVAQGSDVDGYRLSEVTAAKYDTRSHLINA